VGLLGVSDEHGTDWGYPDGKGRTGLWVSELSRAGVREAMTARRFFSTRLRGLRLDAAMNGVRMGQVVGHRAGTVTVDLDLDRGTGWTGRPLVAQLLQTGRPLPTVVHEQAFSVPGDDQPVVRFEAPVDVEDGRWVVLRIVDPEQRRDKRAPAELDGAGGAIAYAAPFFLDPTARRQRSAAPSRRRTRGRARTRTRAGRADARASAEPGGQQRDARRRLPARGPSGGLPTGSACPGPVRRPPDGLAAGRRPAVRRPPDGLGVARTRREASGGWVAGSAEQGGEQLDQLDPLGGGQRVERQPGRRRGEVLGGVPPGPPGSGSG
jgi:hypothetical protein